MNIEKFISPFIQSQFPRFYDTEGPVFIEFVKAYYQWMESQGNIINQARSLTDYRDIDRTSQQFVKYFKDKYLDSIPSTIKADQRLLIKHILDLYRSKGSDRSYALLFRIFFNEDISIFLPKDYIFKTSDNTWVVPRYIEVSDSPFLDQLVGKEIFSDFSRSSALVDNYFESSINNNLVNVLVLTNLRGDFRYGEKIICPSLISITAENAPIIVGSLSSLSIINGGTGFNIGDEFDIIGKTGAEGKAVVSSTRDFKGEVTFNLINGGSGFSLNAVVNVDNESFNVINVSNTNPVIVTTSTNSNIQTGNSLRIDYVRGSDQINTSDYNYFTKNINSTSFSIYNDVNLSNSVNGTNWNLYEANTGYAFLNNGGTGASFMIGSIVNKEILNINTDKISSYYNTVLDDEVSGYNLSISNQTGTFTSGHNLHMANVSFREFDINQLSIIPFANLNVLSNNSLGITVQAVRTDHNYMLVKGSGINNSNLNSGVILSSPSGASLMLNTVFPIQTMSCTANITFVNSSIISVNNQDFYFLNGETITDMSSGATATLTNVGRNTNWPFPSVLVPNIKNLDSVIGSVLTNVDLEVGTISSIKNINPGKGYNLNPVVNIIEPQVASIGKLDATGNLKGFNAVVQTNAVNSFGTVITVDVKDSGYGYSRDSVVSLVGNSVYSVTAATVVASTGTGAGYYLNNKGFTSDQMKIQDSYFYQNYSYQIIAERMLNTYESYVRDLIHPAGMALFGKLVIKDQLTNQKTGVVSNNFSTINK